MADRRFLSGRWGVAHPRLLSAVAQLLGTEVVDLRLTQSDLWPKYGRADRAGATLASGPAPCSASLDQRAVLGFPQPGSPYWCEETVAAVEALYGPFGFDAAPYRWGRLGRVRQCTAEGRVEFHRVPWRSEADYRHLGTRHSCPRGRAGGDPC